MHYVYVLKDSDSELYFGYTNNIERRFKEHNTNGNRKLVYYEAYLSEIDARNREMNLKHYGQSKTHLKRRIKESLQ